MITFQKIKTDLTSPGTTNEPGTPCAPPQLGQEAVQHRKEIPPACKILLEAYWVNAAGGGYEGGSWPIKGTAMTGWAASWVCCARR